jgi:hypothetical protein
MRNLKKAVAAVIMGSVMTAAIADYTFIVPQKPGSGTSVWTSIVAKELEPHLGEKIRIQHIPGANDIPGFNKFHTDLRFDDKTVMVSHGGNGVSYLVDDVKYDYYQYDPIGMMNLTIINGHQAGFNPYTDEIKFSAGSGMNPDMMAHILLKGGANLTMAEAKEIFATEYKYIGGMGGGERRLSYQRGELNVTRESTAAYNKYYTGKDYSKVWFSQGVFNLESGEIDADPNWPNQSIHEVFEQVHGVAPSGEFWEAFELVRNFRDVMQKALWVNKDNPNTPKLVAAFKAMAADPKSMEKIYVKTGKYDWIIGDDMVSALDTLKAQINPATLSNLVGFLQATGKAAIYKEALAGAPAPTVTVISGDQKSEKSEGNFFDKWVN